MATPPFINVIIEELKTKERIGEEKYASAENQTAAIGNFARSALEVIFDAGDRPESERIQCIKENIECMRAAAILMCLCTDADYKLDLNKKDRVRAIIAEILRKITQHREIARGIKSLWDCYSAQFNMELFTTDWNAILISATRDGNVALAKFARIHAAH